MFNPRQGHHMYCDFQEVGVLALNGVVLIFSSLLGVENGKEQV